jgi:hypothetical protein
MYRYRILGGMGIINGTPEKAQLNTARGCGDPFYRCGGRYGGAWERETSRSGFSAGCFAKTHGELENEI